MVSRCVALQWLCGFRTLPRLRLDGSVGMKVNKKHDLHGKFQGFFVFQWVKTMEKPWKAHKNPWILSSWKFQPAIVQLERCTQECEQLIELGFRTCKCPGERWLFSQQNIGPFRYGVQGCDARNLMLEATLECRNISLFTLYYTYIYIYIHTFYFTHIIYTHP